MVYSVYITGTNRTLWICVNVRNCLVSSLDNFILFFFFSISLYSIVICPVSSINNRKASCLLSRKFERSLFSVIDRKDAESHVRVRIEFLSVRSRSTLLGDKSSLTETRLVWCLSLLRIFRVSSVVSWKTFTCLFHRIVVDVLYKYHTEYKSCTNSKETFSLK